MIECGRKERKKERKEDYLHALACAFLLSSSSSLPHKHKQRATKVNELDNELLLNEEKMKIRLMSALLRKKNNVQ